MYTQIIYVCLVFYMSATHVTKLIYEHMDLFVIKPLICVKIIVTSVNILTSSHVCHKRINQIVITNVGIYQP